MGRISSAIDNFAHLYPQREELLVEVTKIAFQGFDYLIIEMVCQGNGLASMQGLIVQW
jgi:hypothetical protein